MEFHVVFVLVCIVVFFYAQIAEMIDQIFKPIEEEEPIEWENIQKPFIENIEE